MIDDVQLTQTIERLISVLTESSGKNPLCQIGMIYEIIGMLYQYCDTTAESICKLNESMGAVLEYVNAHYTEKISPRNVSAIFGYNETYFCRRFRKVTGLTFTGYVRALRLECAQEMLKKGEMKSVR